MKALNRIVTALLAVAVFSVAFFADLLTVRATASLSSYAIQEDISIKRAIELFTGDGMFADVSGSLPEVLVPFKPNMIAFAVFFVLTLAAALAIIAVAAFSNGTKTVSVLSAVGIACLIAARAAFAGIAAAVSDGRITLGTLAGSGWFDLLGKINYVSLSSAPTFMMILFAAIFVWNVSFVAIGIEDKPVKGRAKNKKRR